MKIDYDAIRIAAQRERTEAMQRLIFGRLAAFFRRLRRPEPSRPSAVFPSVRGC